MEFGDYLGHPLWAALFAAAVTAAYIHLRSKMNNEGKLPMSEYTKPAILVGLLVWFIVAYGTGGKEAISTDPF